MCTCGDHALPEVSARARLILSQNIPFWDIPGRLIACRDAPQERVPLGVRPPPHGRWQPPDGLSTGDSSPASERLGRAPA